MIVRSNSFNFFIVCATLAFFFGGIMWSILNASNWQLRHCELPSGKHTHLIGTSLSVARVPHLHLFQISHNTHLPTAITLENKRLCACLVTHTIKVNNWICASLCSHTENKWALQNRFLHAGNKRTSRERNALWGICGVCGQKWRKTVNSSVIR